MSLMWWSHDGKEESERISIYDSVWEQMWACKHTLLLYSPLHIMCVLYKACKSRSIFIAGAFSLLLASTPPSDE